MTVHEWETSTHCSKVLYAQTCQQQDVGFNVSTDTSKNTTCHTEVLY